MSRLPGLCEAIWFMTWAGMKGSEGPMELSWPDMEGKAWDT